MLAIFKIGQKLLNKLRGKRYRDSYVGEHVRRGIAYQIRALRDQRDWNQGRFAKELGKPQSVVSRFEDPSYGKVTVQTLLEVASVFDVALQIRFIPYSSFLNATRDVSTAALEVPSFEDEIMASTNIIRIWKPLATGEVLPIDLGDAFAPQSTEIQFRSVAISNYVQ